MRAVFSILAAVAIFAKTAAFAVTPTDAALRSLQYVLIASELTGEKEPYVAVAWNADLTVLRALKFSGSGRIDLGLPRRVVIIRGLERIVVPVRGRKLNDPNPKLQPDDIVEADF